MNCPRCGKVIELADGKTWVTCPHCGTANAEAIMALDDAEPMAVPPATAITANLAFETTNQVTCPRCGQKFEALSDSEVSWLSCPFCHEANAEALARPLSPSWKRDRAIGSLLIVISSLTAILGTFLTCLGLSLFGVAPPAEGVRLQGVEGVGHEERLIYIAIVGIWVVTSLVVMATGVFLISKRPGAIRKN